MEGQGKARLGGGCRGGKLMSLCEIQKLSEPGRDVIRV